MKIFGFLLIAYIIIYCIIQLIIAARRINRILTSEFGRGESGRDESRLHTGQAGPYNRASALADLPTNKNRKGSDNDGQSPEDEIYNYR